MSQTRLKGIIPILVTPFHENGQLDEQSLRNVVRFELEGGIHGIGIGGFASEAYKLSDDERLRCADIVVDAVAGRVPLVIGIAPGSTETALAQAQTYARFAPAALMTPPPCIMHHDESSLVAYYIALGEASSVPVMVQQSPQIQGYGGCQLSTDSLAQIARRAPNVMYFKIEGPGSARRIHALRERVKDNVAFFGGVGGLSLREELAAGAAGLLPGVGFNELFLDAWAAWQANDVEKVDAILRQAQPLVEAVSGYGHEFSLHARKHLLKRAGIIASAYVRRPTVRPDLPALGTVAALAESLRLRIVS